MKHLIVPVFLFFSVVAFGQMPTVSPIGAGLGHATVAMQTPVAVFSNQAGMTGLTKLAVIAAAEQRFLVSELQSAAVGVALPTRSGTFGLVAQSFGYEGFRQQKIGLSYARKLWKTLSVGAQFNYFQTRIPEYGSRGVLSFEAGIQANISKTLMIGAHLQNPAQVNLVEDENLPTILRLGLAWKVSDKLLLCSEVEKDLDHPFRWKNGLAYQPIEPLYLRAGYATEPSMLFFGVGFAFGNGLQADMASSFHQSLGLSPSAGVVWN